MENKMRAEKGRKTFSESTPENNNLSQDQSTCKVYGTGSMGKVEHFTFIFPAPKFLHGPEMYKAVCC